MGQNFKGECQQRIASQYRRRLVKFFVRRGFAAPQFIIIHRWQIIMHQRITVHTFKRSTNAQSAGAGHIEQARGLKHQKWPQTFPGAQRRIAHGTQQTRRGALGKQLLKHRIRGRGRILQSCFKLCFGC